MKKNTCLTSLALGAAAGLAGTLFLQLLRKSSERALPSTLPPIRRDPGEFLVDKAEAQLSYKRRNRIPDWVEDLTASGLALDYGCMFGLAYAALRPHGGPVALDGAALGLITWATGYLGWLPASGLMPPVWKQDWPEAVGPLLRHLGFGIATAGTYRLLQSKVIN